MYRCLRITLLCLLLSACGAQMGYSATPAPGGGAEGSLKILIGYGPICTKGSCYYQRLAGAQVDVYTRRKPHQLLANKHTNKHGIALITLPVGQYRLVLHAVVNGHKYLTVFPDVPVVAHGTIPVDWTIGQIEV